MSLLKDCLGIRNVANFKGGKLQNLTTKKDRRRVAAGVHNAKCPVCGNAVGDSTTLERTVFGNEALGRSIAIAA